jgi:hypothetical protein
LGGRAPRDWYGEKRKLHEVAKGEVNPEYCIWKGYMEDIHTPRNKDTSGETEE